MTSKISSTLFPCILLPSPIYTFTIETTVVCDIKKFYLMNGMNLYFYATLDGGTRQVLGYSLNTSPNARLVKGTIRK